MSATAVVSTSLVLLAIGCCCCLGFVRVSYWAANPTVILYIHGSSPPPPPEEEEDPINFNSNPKSSSVNVGS